MWIYLWLHRLQVLQWLLPGKIRLWSVLIVMPQTARSRRQRRESTMGINKESNISANLQIGPTSDGMVRIYIEGDGIEVPMDFEPEEAEEIAEEIRAAAGRARKVKP